MNEILNDLSNFHLVLFGIALSIFTLLYSFILSKRDDLKSISAQVKSGNKDPMLTMKESFAKKYILKLKSANRHVVIMALSSFCLFLFNWATLRFVPDKICLKMILFWICVVLTILMMIYIGFIFAKIHKQYRDEIKI